jgi:protein-S-isoprenylcysteine O-methyltransferase Ste14
VKRWPGVAMATAADPLALQGAAGRGLRLRPPVLALLLAATALMLHGAAFGAVAPLGAAPWAGAALGAAALGWMAWAALLFAQARTTLQPKGQPLVLVEEGPYRFGRNPMYLGMAGLLLALALGLGVPLLVLAMAIFTVVIDRVQIPYEEQRLQRHFGGWYSDYKAQVRRWF